jgi:hypothetical protein
VTAQPVVGQVCTLLRGGARELDVTGLQRDHRAREQRPGDGVRVAGHPRRLDRTVKRLRSRAQYSAHRPDRPERSEQLREELALPGGVRDGHRPLGMPLGARKALQVRLRSGEMCGGVKAAREVLVRQSVDECCGLVAHVEDLRCCARERSSACERRDRGGAQCRVVEPSSGGGSLLAPEAHRAVVHPMNTAHGELHHQRDRFGRPLIDELVQRSLEAGLCPLMRTHQVLDASADRRQPQAHRRRLTRNEPETFKQRGVRVVEAPDRRQRSGVAQQQLDAHDRSGGVR